MKTRRSTASTLRQRNAAIFQAEGRLELEEGLALFRHSRSKMIWADHRLPGGERTRLSTRNTDLELAGAAAKRQHKELSSRLRNGLPLTTTGPTVGDLLRAYEETLQKCLASGDKSVKPELSVLQKNLMPFWADKPLKSLSRQMLLEWARQRQKPPETVVQTRSYMRGDKRITADICEKAPSASTLQREKTQFVRALTWGSNQIQPWLSDDAVDEIRHAKLPSKKAKKGKGEWRREALTREQVEELVSEFERWEELEAQRVAKLGEKGRRKNYARRLMGCRVLLLFASGLRPGAEINDLIWKNIRIEKLSDGRATVVIDPCGDGKTGPRIVNCLPEAVAVIDRLKKLLIEFGFPITGDAPLWPNLKGGIVNDMNNSFKSVMRKLGFDEELSSEPLYICRHTYITGQLRNGISSDIVATNCGTSVEMIEKHYKHLKADQVRDALVPSDPRNPLGLQNIFKDGGLVLTLGADGAISAPTQSSADRLAPSAVSKPVAHLHLQDRSECIQVPTKLSPKHNGTGNTLKRSILARKRVTIAKMVEGST